MEGRRKIDGTLFGAVGAGSRRMACIALGRDRGRGDDAGLSRCAVAARVIAGAGRGSGGEVVARRARGSAAIRRCCAKLLVSELDGESTVSTPCAGEHMDVVTLRPSRYPSPSVSLSSCLLYCGGDRNGPYLAIYLSVSACQAQLSPLLLIWTTEGARPHCISPKHTLRARHGRPSLLGRDM